MPNTEVIGDREQGRIKDLLRQADKDKVIKKILAGGKEPEKWELDFFLENFVKGNFAECGIGEPVIAYYEKYPKDFGSKDSNYGNGFFVAYFAGTTNTQTKLCFRKEIHPKHEIFPDENTLAAYLPDGVIKLSHKESCYGTAASIQKGIKKRIRALPAHTLVEIGSGIYGTNEFSYFIGFLGRRDDKKIQLLAYKNVDGRYIFPREIDFGERYIESLHILEPKIELPEGTELSDKVKKWLQLE